MITLLIVVGLGGLALWWLCRQPTATGAAQTLPGTCGGGVMGSIGQFIKGHVDRKNAVAPLVVSAYAKVPPNQAAGLTNLAGQVSPSGYIEGKIGNAVGDFFCKLSIPSFGAIANAVANTGQKVVNKSTTFGQSQLEAGTVGPVKALGSAGNNLVHGNFGSAASDVAKSVYEGPKSAVTSTLHALGF